MRSLLRNSLFCLLGACLATACDKHTVYHSYHSLHGGGWAEWDTLCFQVPVTDSLPPTLRLFAEVRNNTSYPYQDLHLLVCQNLQDSTTWRTDSVTLYLADSTGKWKGKGWGSLYVSSIFVRSVRPLHPANYTVKVICNMKTDGWLPGINDVGIRIERATN